MNKQNQSNKTAGSQTKRPAKKKGCGCGKKTQR